MNRRTITKPSLPGRPHLRAAALCLACLFLSCGSQGPPLPPRVEQPVRVSDLALIQTGRRLEINFTTPVEATDGERLSKPIEVRLFRAMTAPGQSPSEAPAALSPWVTILPADLARYTHGAKVEYSYSLPDAEFSQSLGETLTIAVRALTRGFRGHPVESELSNFARAILLDVSRPPANLQARATERGIELNWSAPAQTLRGQPISSLSGYRVFRSEGAEAFKLRDETQTPSYLDPNFRFGHAYSYKVRAVFSRDGRSAESEDSASLSITPRDVFPPATPSGLSAVYAAGVVELIWTPNNEPDLAGYNVYRREEPAAPARINPDLFPTPLYRDAAVAPGHRYLYRVTAVDLAGNESAPCAETAVETR